MSDPQRPPYEDVFDEGDVDETVDLDKHATVARPMPVAVASRSPAR
jgi:hypothetical protein